MGIPRLRVAGHHGPVLFQERVLNMSDTAEKSYWQDEKIKRAVTPPPEFTNVQKAVFSLSGSIGYCLESEHKPGTNRVVFAL